MKYEEKSKRMLLMPRELSYPRYKIYTMQCDEIVSDLNESETTEKTTHEFDKFSNDEGYFKIAREDREEKMLREDREEKMLKIICINYSNSNDRKCFSQRISSCTL